MYEFRDRRPAYIPLLHLFQAASTNPSTSANNSSGFSNAAKCPPPSCLPKCTKFILCSTQDFGVGNNSFGKYEYPHGLPSYGFGQRFGFKKIEALDVRGRSSD